MWFMERENEDGETIRLYHRFYNRNCPKHGWKYDPDMPPTASLSRTRRG